MPAAIPPRAEPMGLSAHRELLVQRLAAWDRRHVDAVPPVRRAAVAITLLDRGSEAHVLIIKRAGRGMNPGQWALPGGKLDAGEDSVTAALRELHEETGAVASGEDVLGLLDDFATRSGFVITPVVVAVAPTVTWHRNRDEVSSLHPIPVSRLLAPGVPRWRTGAADTRLLQFPLRHDMVVHAPTGAMLWQFAEVGLRGVSRRVQHLSEPAFTAT